MKTICKEYISNVKAFFPLKGKKERKYIKDLEINVNDYCLENNISSIDVLYQEFGSPTEVVNSYFSALNTTDVIKKIRISKFVKIFLCLLLIVSLVIAIIFCSYLICVKDVIKEQEIVFKETIIE